MKMQQNERHNLASIRKKHDTEMFPWHKSNYVERVEISIGLIYIFA